MSTESVPPKAISPLLARVADYITLRVNEQETAIKHYVNCQDSLRQQLQQGKITQMTYNNEMNILDDTTSDTMLEFQVIDKQFRLVAQDMEDDVLGMKAVGTPAAGEDELVEKSYFSVVGEAKKTEMLWRQRYYDAPMEDSKVNSQRSELDRRVLSYYNATRTMREQRQAHCSLTGWYPEAEVGVAQLVPGCISSEQISFLFGANQMNLVNGKNCIPLQRNLADALDCGIITFIPLPPTDVDQGPTWTCILVDDSFRDRVFAIGSDGKKLTYRPNIAWPVPGRYVDKESLLMLGRSISGTELPELLYKGMVFEKVERPADFADVALCLVVRGWVRKTIEAGKDGIGCVDSKKEGDGDLSTEDVSRLGGGENDDDMQSQDLKQESKQDKQNATDIPLQESPEASNGRKKRKSQESSN
ncbi:hypothetical protein KEM54_004626 [Ascosphaera aggregata]|nr:hypothetical protein KEM54_004626 [Ascosphaera aggregata]